MKIQLCFHFNDEANFFFVFSSQLIFSFDENREREKFSMKFEFSLNLNHFFLRI